MYRVVLATALAGCGFTGRTVGAGLSDGGIDTTTSSPDGTTTTDGTVAIDGSIAIDGSVTSADAGMCFGTGLLRVCLNALPTSAAMPTGNINTDTGCTQVVAQSTGPDVCVIAGTTVSVTGAVTATGTRPLVLLGTSAITISGTVDVSSNATRTGSGANYGPICNTASYLAGSGEDDGGGGGGGAGGGFGTPGATGGLGDTNDNHLPTPHMGIPHPAGVQQPQPTVLRGGCPGGAGGGGSETALSSLGGPGGASGGAVYLIAGNTITISGNVFASGAGGGVHAGNPGFEEGGGGGGSGGMIGINAPMIQIDGIVAANGGAGGGGGGNVGGTAGAPGSTMQYTTRAAHGVGDATGTAGDGGDGTALNASTPPAVASTISGAGGGGGGVGVVWIDGTVGNGTKISPSPTSH